MKFIVLTLFPDMFTSPFQYSIVHRAQSEKAIEIEYVNIRDFSTDAYKSVDDHPYGGEKGMILRVDILERALAQVKQSLGTEIQTHVILLDPRGTTYTQKKAKELTQNETIILICGRYEGFDERIREYVDETISIGDYIVTGGELPAMMIIDSVTRLLPGVLATQASTSDESFSDNLLEYPQYTRPEIYNGSVVPEILLSGNHAKIKEWRKQQSVELTKKHRPDLLK